MNEENDSEKTNGLKSGKVFEIHVSKFPVNTSTEDIVNIIMENTTLAVADGFNVELLSSQKNAKERNTVSFKVSTLKRQIFDEIIKEETWAPNYKARKFINVNEKTDENQRQPKRLFFKRNNYNSSFETPKGPRRMRANNNMRRQIFERNSHKKEEAFNTYRNGQRSRRYDDTPRNEYRYNEPPWKQNRNTYTPRATSYDRYFSNMMPQMQPQQAQTQYIYVPYQQQYQQPFLGQNPIYQQQPTQTTQQ